MARPEKKDTDKLTVTMPIRLSVDSKTQYRKLASSKGLSVSEYIRQLVEQDANSRLPNKVKAGNDNQPVSNQFDEQLLYELYRIGNNLNQLTKKFHSHNIEPPGLRSLFPVLEEVLTLVFQRLNVE